jgi:acetate kinase
MRIFAVFDTEFFHSLPVSAQLYGLPRHLIQRHRIRRFGFHGFAHAGLHERWRTVVDGQDRVSSDKRVVTLQLGSGCSMAAINGVEPIDTTMGFTPNEGLLMSTRSGDIDPGLLTWLQRQEGWTPEETDRVLNEESGWLGLSGEGGDFSQLLNNSTPEAKEAVQLFSIRVRKTLGAYHALLGGLDGVVIGGGVAESTPTLCLHLLQDLEHLGIKVARQPPPVPGPEQPFSILSSSDSCVLCGLAANNEFWSMLQTLRRVLIETSAAHPSRDLPQNG